MKNKKIWIFIILAIGLIVGGLILFRAEPSLAQWDQWRQYIPEGLSTKKTLANYIQDIINAALLLAGVVAVVYLIIGGYRYITASGNAEAIAEAKTTIMNSIIGLVIIFASYVMIDFVYQIVTHGSGGIFGIIGGGSGGNVGQK